MMGSGNNTVAKSAITLNTPRTVAANPAFRQEPGIFMFHYSSISKSALPGEKGETYSERMITLLLIGRH